jgi:hypothetical protein
VAIRHNKDDDRIGGREQSLMLLAERKKKQFSGEPGERLAYMRAASGQQFCFHGMRPGPLDRRHRHHSCVRQTRSRSYKSSPPLLGGERQARLSSMHVGFWPITPACPIMTCAALPPTASHLVPMISIYDAFMLAEQWTADASCPRAPTASRMVPNVYASCCHFCLDST